MRPNLNLPSLLRLTGHYHRAFAARYDGTRDALVVEERLPFDQPLARARALEQVNEWNRQSTLKFHGWIYWLAPEDSQ